jgi:hypothetical protein
VKTYLCITSQEKHIQIKVMSSNTLTEKLTKDNWYLACVSAKITGKNQEWLDSKTTQSTKLLPVSYHIIHSPRLRYTA